MWFGRHRERLTEARCASAAGHRPRGAAKLVGAVTFIAHGFGTVTESIWGGRPWSASVKYLLDAALYALGTWAVFLWLWP